jgi:hypothetical protein
MAVWDEDRGEVNFKYYGLLKALLPCGSFLYFLFFSLSVHLPSFNMFTYSKTYNSQPDSVFHLFYS